MSLDVQLAVEAGNRVSVTTFPFVVGRDPETDFVLAAEIVSRRHFQLLLEDGTLVVEDLNSANGLFVNDERIERATLKHLDRLRAGDVELVVLIYKQAAALPNVTPHRPQIELG